MREGRGITIRALVFLPPSASKQEPEKIMDKEVSDAIAELKAQGIPVAVDPSGRQADLYIATAPNGEKYEFEAAGLLDLKAKAKLHLEGLQELHFAKKETPNFHNPSRS
jgi:hypothetical protein